MAYRGIPHSSTGFSPNFLLMGREVEVFGCRPRMTGDEEDARDPVVKLHERLELAHREARERAERAWAERTKYCNRNRRPRSFKEGDLVYLHVPAVKVGHCPKFHCPWTGPHKVTQAISRVTYKIRLSTGNEIVVHINRLKQAYGPGDPDNERGGRVRERPCGGERPDEPEETPWIFPGPQYNLEDEEEIAHEGCPVDGGVAAECTYPGCPLGGTFRESPPDTPSRSSQTLSRHSPTIAEREGGEEDSWSEDNETIIRRGPASPATTTLEHSEEEDAEPSPGRTEDMSEESQTSSEVSEWEPQPGTGLVRERSPYELRSRRAPR